MSKKKVKTLIEYRKENNGVAEMFIVNEEEEIETCYGTDVFKITPKHIEALKSGKQLYFLENDGEYAGVIFMGEEE